MKKISLLFSFVALFATASFAKTGEMKTITDKKIVAVNKTESLKEKTCKVTVSWTNASGGTTTLTVTNTCNNCTTQQACDAAYAIISIVVPG